MPVMTCQRDGKPGHKWGPNGVCFIGPGSRGQAEAVGRAIAARTGEGKGEAKETISPEDLATGGGLLNPDQREKCPAGFRRNRRGDCVPVKKTEALTHVRVRKVDEELRLVYGEVYAPMVPDTQGDFMVQDEIRKMAHRFLVARRQKNVDEQHDNHVSGAVIVESFLVREGDPDFPIPGSWAVAAWVQDEEIWNKVKAGEINGFSMEAAVTPKLRSVIIELDSKLTGMTEEENGHTHDFTLEFDDEGNLIRGRTNNVDEHWHEITENTVTGPDVAAGPGRVLDGHQHGYSFLEFLNIVPQSDIA